MRTEYRRVFFDSTPIIYYLEENERYYPHVVSWLKLHAQAAFVSSVISVMEYLIYPYRKRDDVAVKEFHDFLSDYEVTIFSIDEAIAMTAAEIRAEYTDFKAMDALQLATAMISGCDAFLTNDKQLRRFSGLPILLVDDLPSSDKT